VQIIKKYNKQANYIFFASIIIHILVTCVEFGEWDIPYRGRIMQIAFLLCCIKILMTYYSKLEWLIMTLIGLVGVISYSHTGEKYVLYVMVLVFAAKSVDMDKVLKAILYAMLVSTLLIALLSIVGVGGTLVDIRDYGRGTVENRYCFGFSHPNNIHGVLWYVTAIAILLFKDKFDWKYYSVFTAVNFGLYIFTVSRTGLIVTQLVIIGGLFYTYANKYIFDKVWVYIVGCIGYIGIIALTLASVIVCSWEGYGPILGIVDRFTTGRVNLAYKYARIEWWHIWEQGGVSNSIIDNGFAAIGINLGYIVWGIYVCFVAYLLYISAKQRDGILLVVIMASILYMYMESSFAFNSVYLICNPLYLVAMKTLGWNSGNEKIYDEWILKVIKHELTKAIVFVLVLVFLLQGVSYVIRSSGETKDRFAGFYAEKIDSIDVLLIGPSTVSTSFIPAYMWDKYGFTSYPLSSNAQRPKAIKYVIEEGLKYQEADLVVIEPRTFIASYEEQAKDEGHIRETVDNMNYSVNRIKTINALTEEFDDKYPFYFDIMKYHSNYGLLFKASEWKKFDFSQKNDLKGYELRNEEEKYREKDGNRRSDAFCYTRKPIPVKQEEVLRDLLVYLQENNIRTLFVVTPRDHDEEYEGNMCYMKDIINEYGFEMIDTNELFEEVGFDYRYDMADGAHTNVWGAVKVSDYIGKCIKDRIGNLDHLESVTIDWDNAYSIFSEIYENTEPDIK